MNRFFSRVFLLLILLTALTYFSACSNNSDNDNGMNPILPPEVETIKPTIINIFPHDSSAFTQGLLFHENFLYESTGFYGASSLRKTTIQSGEVLQSVAVNNQYFAEGLTLKNNRLVQLTWLERTAFIYDFPSMNLIGSFSYTGEGWGLTTDSSHFIMSNGSENIYFRDDSFQIVRTIKVTIEDQPQNNLNELEYANSRIYANVWRTASILEISPATGEVSRIIDCSELYGLENPTDPSAVLNGVAYNPQTNTFYCTGKLWKSMFEIRID